MAFFQVISVKLSKNCVPFEFDLELVGYCGNHAATAVIWIFQYKNIIIWNYLNVFFWHFSMIEISFVTSNETSNWIFFIAKAENRGKFCKHFWYYKTVRFCSISIRSWTCGYQNGRIKICVWKRLFIPIKFEIKKGSNINKR